MRVIEKFNTQTNEWEVIGFDKLIAGDVFRIFDNGERYVVTANLKCPEVHDGSCDILYISSCE